MEYLAAHPSFKIKYSIAMKLVDLLSGYADADWGNSFPQIDVRHGHAVQQVAYYVEVEDAEDDGALDCGGRVLPASAAGCEVLYLRDRLRRLGFGQRKPTPIYEDNTACIEWGNDVFGGRERAKHIDIRKHFAHEVIQNGEMRLIKVATKY